MSAQRLTDVQIATALRAHLPAHARSDVRGRIASEVATVRQARPMPILLAPFTDADPEVRRRATLLVAAALLALAAAVIAVVGALIDRNDRPLITADAATNPALFVEQAYNAHGQIPAMTIVARFWDYNQGPVDVQRFVFDGLDRVRHECCDGTIIILTPEMYSSTNTTMDNERVFVVGPANGNLPGWELVQYTYLQPECQRGWRYLGEEVIEARAAIHVACGNEPRGGVEVPDREFWIDGELGIVLRHISWSVESDENGEPVAAYGSEMVVESLTFGDPPPDAFVPPPGIPVMTVREFNCEIDEQACGPTDPPATAVAEPAPTPVPVENPPDAPDIAQLVADTLASYEGPSAMWVETWDQDGGGPASRRYADGRGSFREERALDADYGPVVGLWIPEGYFESYPDVAPDAWRQHGEPGMDQPMYLFTLFLSNDCENGWRYLGLDLLFGSEAWHIACDRQEFWIDRTRLLVLRRLLQPDALSTDIQIETVVTIEFGPQPPELFELPEDANFDW